MSRCKSGTLSGRYRRNGYVHGPTVLTVRPSSQASQLPHWIAGHQLYLCRLPGRHGSKLPRHDAGLDRRDGRQHADANGQYQKAEQENCHLGHKASEGKGTTGVSGWGYCPPQAVFNTGADRKEKTVSDHRAAPGPWLFKRPVFIKISAMAAASLERHLRQALHLPLR